MRRKRVIKKTDETPVTAGDDVGLAIRQDIPQGIFTSARPVTPPYTLPSVQHPAEFLWLEKSDPAH